MKICLNCSRPSPTAYRRGNSAVLCDACYRSQQIQRNETRSRIYGPEWKRISEEARQIQPWCTKCFATTDLTFDHETGTVECRSCNSKHKGTTVKDA